MEGSLSSNRSCRDRLLKLLVGDRSGDGCSEWVWSSDLVREPDCELSPRFMDFFGGAIFLIVITLIGGR